MWKCSDCFLLFDGIMSFIENILQFDKIFSNLLFAVSGVWAEWGEWSECDPSWSGGNKFRFRNCNNAPSSAACDGDPTEKAPCSSESTNQPTCQNATNPGDLLEVRQPLSGFERPKICL